MNKPYIPISCTFHDILLDRSTRRKEVRVIYSKDRKRFKALGIIEDVFTKDKVEYLRIKDGPTIRLDDLISVDKEAIADYSSC